MHADQKLPSYEDIIQSDLRDLLKLDNCDLDGEYLTCGANLAYVGALAARGRSEASTAKDAMERVRGVVWIEKREYLTNAHGKATEKLIDAHTDNDPRVIVAEGTHTEAELIAEELRAVYEGMKARKDALLEIGRNRRAEWSGDPSVAALNRERGRKLMGEG